MQRRGAQRRARADRRGRARARCSASAWPGCWPGSLARPLRALARHARRVAGGDLDARARRGGLDRAARGGLGLQRHDRAARRARCARSASSWPTRRTSCARRSPGCGCGSRRPALKSSDPRGASASWWPPSARPSAWRGCSTELLTLARERERPEPEARLARGGRARRRASAGRRRPRHGGHGWSPSGDGVAGGRGHRGRPGRDPRQPGRERAQLLARRAPPSTIEWGGDADSARLAVLDEGPGHRPGRARARLRALLPRRGQPRRRAGHRASGLSVVEALARALGRRGPAGEPAARAARGPSVRLPLRPAGEPCPDPQLDDALPGRG